jgi:hypothetical protein
MGPMFFEEIDSDHCVKLIPSPVIGEVTEEAKM